MVIFPSKKAHFSISPLNPKIENVPLALHHQVLHAESLDTGLSICAKNFP